MPKIICPKVKSLSNQVSVVSNENRQPLTAAKFITKNSLFILLLCVIRWLELKPNSKQKAENIFEQMPYRNTNVEFAIVCLTIANTMLAAVVLQLLISFSCLLVLL